MKIIELVWNFIQYQLLGMRWLNKIIELGLSKLGVNTSNRIGGSIQFFIYDSIKILFLLSIFIYIISYIQSYFPPERTKKILGRFSGIKANVLSALLGTITPFCSCSSIPLFIGFTNAGLPVGVTFSFLISSPLVDLGAIMLLVSVFGIKIAISYVIVGLILAVVGGTIIDKLGMEKYVEEFIKQSNMHSNEAPTLTRKDRVSYASEQMRETVNKVFPYVIVGVGIGAMIHNWIPTYLIQNILGSNNKFAVLIATVVGVPMYADIFGTIPIAEALHSKGVGIGTVLSFMMAVTALSLPSIIMLKNAVKPKLLKVFVEVVTVGIIIIGYVFNLVNF
ncbi:permease [Clostridium novyi A str. 4552]|uniref:Permease n=1 Tax=Clostridium novyi A str. 4552 TaxID=1444289 RepID=A0A0A0I968_CLONO|nr:permease [Clostridium novyi]KGM98029.1 permease [Clostridium novyi A str. 4552]